MPSKLQTTVAMAEYTAKDISSRPEVFTEFLTTAAHNYKYGFRDQMLIFAQKPNATACALLTPRFAFRSFANSRLNALSSVEYSQR